jgi:cytochrome c6
MKWQTLTYPVIWGVLVLLLPSCGGGGGGYVAPLPTAAPAPPAAPALGYTMGPGMQQNFGMMRNNMGQMYGMMGRGMMNSGNYNQMMGMMGQMGGMMQEMGGPYYNQETEQRHRQQLEGIHQNLNAMASQGGAGGASAGSEIFTSNCAACHPNGGNSINPNLPLEGAPQLGSYSSFRSLVRQGRGAMPPFSSGRIPDAQLRELYRYVNSAYGG